MAKSHQCLVGKPTNSHLLTLPDEIIEQIADDLCDNLDDEDYAACYLSDHFTSFSHDRFDLSSFSKVCWSVRWPVERSLYRDIHVHFDGWTGLDKLTHPESRGGNLHLLLRTLEGRIDLCGRVRSVQMDWDVEDVDESSSSRTVDEDALRQFFSRCPRVQRLNLMTFPSQLSSETTALSQITTVATSTSCLDMFHTIVKTFPVLQDLHLKLDYMDTPPTYGFHHQLKKFRIESHQVDAPCVFWALEVCAHTTEELWISASGYSPGARRSPRSPVLTLSPSACTNLRSLRLDGNQLNFLAHPNSSLAQAIRQLPSLQRLHMSRCLSFHAAAFSALPASLRCLLISDYGEWVDDGRSRHAFVVALSNCLVQTARVIEMVAVTKRNSSGLSPLQSVCNDRNIPLHINICETSWPLRKIQIPFA